mmetsp:Transcript_10970/g.13738  ORF Transcript_10970/g.13738 Transcript_10970/m.13738 type:complete len:118 (-) Transcript_10970:120-473(-)
MSMDYFDLFLSLASVILVAFLGELNPTLAAAGATPPITSSIAIVLFDRQHYRNMKRKDSKDQFHLVEISGKVVKGVTASLVFAICFHFLARNKFSLWPCMVFSCVAWTMTWVMLQYY